GSFYGKFTKDIFGRKLTTKSNGTKQTFFAKSAETFIKKIFKDHSSGEDTVVFDVRFLALVNAPLGGRQNSEFAQHKTAMQKGMERLGKQGKYCAFGLNVGNDTNQIGATTGLNTKSIEKLKLKLDAIEKNKGVNKLSIAEQFAYHKLRELIAKDGDKLTERHNAPLFLSCLTLLEKELDIILVCGCLHAKDRTSSVILTSKAISALAVEAESVKDMYDFFDKDLYASPKWDHEKYKHITKTFEVDKEFLWHINGSSCGVKTNVNSRVIKSFLKKTKNIISKSYFNEVKRISISG
ncbi:MAG: hypothetical protein QG673_1583, partial [Pseudomonadota bacterium]|nr:hypothetical protein [Pseudomonadota bacterium]